MEASLLQVYAPRDPLGEYLAGGISFRKLRVMVEGLPRDPSTPIGRAINGPWGDREALLHLVASSTQNLAASYYNLHKKPGSELAEPKPLPLPKKTYYQRQAEKAAAYGNAHDRVIEDGLLAVLALTSEGENHG